MTTEELDLLAELGVFDRKRLMRLSQALSALLQLNGAAEKAEEAPRAWEAEARRLAKEGLPRKEIARCVGVDPSMVSRFFSENRLLPRGRGGRKRLKISERRVRYLARHMNLTAISEEIGVSRTPLIRFCKERGIEPVRTKRRAKRGVSA